MIAKALDKTILLLFVGVLYLLGAPATAQELKLGVVNIARLLEEAPQARATMQALQDEFAPRQREIVAQEKEVRDLEENLQRNVAVMADAERRSAEKNLRDKQRELLRRRDEYLEDVNLRRNEELARLQRSLLKEVQEFGRASNYDLIIGDGVLFASGTLDITSEVLARLEASFQSVSQRDAD